MKATRRWQIVTLAAVLVAAFTLTMTPASSHVSGWAHTWKQHIKPKTDKRYYTKKASNQSFSRSTLAPGKVANGVWAASSKNGGYGVGTIDYGAKLSGPVNKVYASSTSANCPGVGQAAPGYLCLYPEWSFGMSYHAAIDVVAARLYGTTVYFESTNDQGNVRGSWTVRAPLSSARVAPQPRQALPPSMG